MMTLLLLLSCTVPAPAHAATPGKVDVAAVGGKCQVSVTTAEQGVVQLLTVDDCSVGSFGLNEEHRIGTLLLPAAAPTGEQFHLLTIPTARGGNACGGDDVYVVATSPGHGWASENLGDCATFASGELTTGVHGATLALVQDPTTRWDGKRVEIWLGGSTTTAIPATPATGPDSPRSFSGTLNALGGGWTNLEPFVEDSKGNQEIFAAGPCKLDPLDGKPVKITVKRAPPNTGPADDVCVSISSVP